MIILNDSTNLQAVLAGAVSANQPEVHVTYVDLNVQNEESAPATTRTALNSASDVTVLAAPTTSPRRKLIALSLYNKDTASITVTVKSDDGTERIFFKVTLLTLESLHWDGGCCFVALDVNGNRKEVTSSSFTTITATSITLSGGTALSSYVETSHVTTCTGYSSDPSVTVLITKVGRLVHLTIPSFTGTSDATSKALADVLPAAYRPLGTTNIPTFISDNGGATVAAIATVSTGGAVTFFATVAAGAWTASGTATVNRAEISYTV